MYSIDYRKRAVEYKREGHTLKELKETFKIAPQTYYNWEKEYDDGGSRKPSKPRQRSRKIDKDQLLRALEERPDAYLYELAELFNCTPPAIYYALEKLGITLKKDFHILRKIRRTKTSVYNGIITNPRGKQGVRG